MKFRFALFWDFAQRRMVLFTGVSRQRTSPIFKRQSALLLDCLIVKDETDILSRNIGIKLRCVKFHKSANFIGIALGVWNYELKVAGNWATQKDRNMWCKLTRCWLQVMSSYLCWVIPIVAHSRNSILKIFTFFGPFIVTYIYNKNQQNSHIINDLILTLRRLTTYIYTSYRTANFQTLHYIYLVNKYTYWIF
jgi:hypothetical protein